MPFRELNSLEGSMPKIPTGSEPIRQLRLLVLSMEE
jgi:hypothetical protein